MGATGAYILATHLPHPEDANPDELMRWLVTQDLSAEAVEIRLAVAKRLEEESQGGVDWEAAARSLSAAQRQRLWENLPVLLEPWLMDKVDGYFGLSRGSGRSTWIGSSTRCGSGAGSTTCVPRTRRRSGTEPPSSGLMTVLCRRMEVLGEEAEPARRERLERFVTAVQTRWFVRVLREVMPSQGWSSCSAAQRGFGLREVARGGAAASMSSRSEGCQRGRPLPTRSASTSSFSLVPGMELVASN